ncbi:hypothetical protein AS038_12220 [Arthrobacter sp. NIO-1057]|nr:hypothetical protein AS038_12220 [Arthrobacter sp. NIO-1057]
MVILKESVHSKWAHEGVNQNRDVEVCNENNGRVTKESQRKILRRNLLANPVRRADERVERQSGLHSRPPFPVTDSRVDD